jgi:hypothetical protein
MFQLSVLQPGLFVHRAELTSSRNQETTTLNAHFLATPKLNRPGAQGWQLPGVVSSCATPSDRQLDCKHRAYLKHAR